MRKYDVQENEVQITPAQQSVYQEILNSVTHHLEGTFFLDAPGGTGKIFLIYLILNKL